MAQFHALQLVLISQIILAYFLGPVSSATEYGYGPDDGPSNWPEMFETCDGTSQSPIDITTSDAVPKNMGMFELVGFGDTPPDGAAFDIKNNGHTITVHVGDGYYVSGGDLPTTFKVAQFHFHWGNDSTEGSEHHIDGAHYPAEVHVVTYNYQKYSSLSDAVTESDGLAVLGACIEISQTDNAAFDPIIEALGNVTYKDQRYYFASPFPIGSMLPEDTDRFFRYSGGLTSPGCYESVTWTMMEGTVEISEQQLAAMRQLRITEAGETEEYMERNFRPPQALNGRTVYVNDLTVEDDASAVRPLLAVVVLSFVLTRFFH